MNDYRQHIEISADIRFGKPSVKNTRIAVYEVLAWLAKGMSVEEIIEDFPELSQTDIRLFGLCRGFRALLRLTASPKYC